MKHTNNFLTSDQAEDAFYLAFQQRDIEMMMSVWSKDKNTSCIHPGGPRLDGLDTIHESWEQIFIHEQGIKFGIRKKRVFVEENIAIHNVIEEISINGELQSEIIATNIYCKTENSWHMVLHHASPELHVPIDQLHLEEVSEKKTMH